MKCEDVYKLKVKNENQLISAQEASSLSSIFV
jgi:hypothetical protein